MQLSTSKWSGLCAAWVVAATACMWAGEPAKPDAVTLTPAIVLAGAPELIRINAPAEATVDGEWMGKKLEFFRGRDGKSWYALAGVDVESGVGPSKLTLMEHKTDGSTVDLSRDVEIHAAHYATGVLTVEPKFVEPPPEEMARIKSEVELKTKVFSSSVAEPLWNGNFRAPVTAAATSSFGMRRTYNGTLASVHKGMDFRAAMGTPVRAGNSGVVVLARPLYYEGNCVVIDHGLGLFTVSMHLSRIDVKEGQHVAKGEQTGLSGATGRVTGPHLHWAVRWQDAYLDPAKMLKMNLAEVR
jgi:murein DD-endopeptidase MepM/ murein hydrolase activator NlpD